MWVHTDIPVLFLLPSVGLPQVPSLFHLLLGQTFIPVSQAVVNTDFLCSFGDVQLVHTRGAQPEGLATHTYSCVSTCAGVCLHQWTCSSPADMEKPKPCSRMSDLAVPRPAAGRWWGSASGEVCEGAQKPPGIPVGKKACTLLRGVIPLRELKGFGWHFLAGVLKRGH